MVYIEKLVVDCMWDVEEEEEEEGLEEDVELLMELQEVLGVDEEIEFLYGNEVVGLGSFEEEKGLEDIEFLVQIVILIVLVLVVQVGVFQGLYVLLEE